jgi:hypothetical protein
MENMAPAGREELFVERCGVTGPVEGAAYPWVTVDGRPVIAGQGLERFVPLAAFR